MVVGKTGVSGTGAASDIYSQNFDALNNGAIHGQDSYVEEAPATTNFTVDDSQGYGGAGKSLNTNIDTGDDYLYRLFTRQNVDDLTIEFYFRMDDDTVNSVDFEIRDSTSGTVSVRIQWNGGDIEWDDGGGFENICAACYSADTWYKVEIFPDFTNNDFDFHLDDVSKGTNLDFVDNDDGMDKIRWKKDRAEDSWFDSIRIYRQ
jgi:hypothetical protein